MATFILIVVVALLAAAAFALLARKRQTIQRITNLSPNPAIEKARETELRHEEMNRRGTELLERRAELDTRRGALGGDTNLDAALQALEVRRKSGQIDESEFESEKRTLLGG